MQEQLFPRSMLGNAEEMVNAITSLPFDIVIQANEIDVNQNSLSNAQSLLAELWSNFIYRLPGLAVGVLVMVIFITLATPLSRLLVKPLTRATTSPLLRSVIQRSISTVVVLLGIYLFLFLAGLTGFAIAVVSGTGVVGLILGFAFRDIAENFISSLLLTVQRPFRIGDIVQINEFTGIIQKVTARATTLVDFDGNHIQIPNATIYKGVIKNLTANPLMRGNFIVGVGYDANVQQAQQIAQSVIASQSNVLIDPEPQVLIDNLGSSTYNIKVYFWVDVEKTSVLKMASLLMRNIVAAYTDAGISMPDDARERIFPEGLQVINGPKQGNAPTVEKQTASTQKNVEVNASDDDVATEAHDIREQARRSRDPEAGENIL
ncbi:mechanosensitive ion channel family protein [Alteromonas sp. 009811495]|uniref:mechanosensitive ion channel family protein n=1 Tax=Alteromonas sp. 009811495 TaxID=3002962 RepID=UPI00237D387A|nr:mechanosensitive ion channel family protein [Alteromonas sp. 009811495]WDT87673.1 mechanosensitive ion channel family protein [Alteromonas sp. 009811495]